MNLLVLIIAVGFSTALIVFLILAYYDGQIPRFNKSEGEKYLENIAFIKTILLAVAASELFFLINYLSR
jgi:hypothetical protein